MVIASGRSRLRLGFLSLAVLSGCSGKPAVGALEVQVNLEPGLSSRCVKVSATDGTSSRETMPIPLAGKSAPLRVGIAADGVSPSVSVQALGYSDEGCTTRVETEFSEKADGTFTSPRRTVTLTLRTNPVSNTDGGSDAGTDAGTDAGIDADRDGFPVGDDCDDTNAAINRNATELCSNGLDDDCDTATDCQDTACDTMGCGANGTCVGKVCIGPTEFPCNDGLDNNGNTLVDCEDPGCTPGTICSDSDPCTTGDRCVNDGGCEKVADFACNSPPNTQCYMGAGLCLPDAGANCSYTPMGGNCIDGLACTDMDSCTAGTCAGTQRTCPPSNNVCLAAMGACQEPSGTCIYAPRAVGSGSCDDGQNCTTFDTCNGDGGCAGAAVNCPAATQCQVSNGCNMAGACQFNSRNGIACDAGTGAGTCDNSFNCVANPASLFPTTPSNFTEAQLPAGAGAAITVSCPTTLNTSGTPSITNGSCVSMPPFSIITQGGESIVLIRVPSLTVNLFHTLSIVGSRPVIFAVTGNVVIDGTIRALNGFGPAACGNGGNGNGSGSGSGLGGGGGGGFGSAGAQGGSAGGSGGGTAPAPNGQPALIPLRGGCNGGDGQAAGGKGGGAVQLTASGSITVSGVITTPGGSGQGANASTGNSGGGGGSGGAILLEAATVILNFSARLTANGGSGGEGSGGDPGFDGNDGNELSGAATPNGGNNSAAGGNGGAGAGLSTAAGAGISGATHNDGAGGGGGGVGRIRINASMSCNVTSGLIISPAATSNGLTACP